MHKNYIKDIIKRVTGRNSELIISEFQPHTLAIQDTPPSPFTRIILWILVLLVILIIIWSYFSRVPIMTSAPGKFSSKGSTKIVQSLNNGTVSRIFVKKGLKVSKGQVIVELDNTVNYSALVNSKKSLMLNNLEIKRILMELNGEAGKSVKPASATSKIAIIEQRLGLANLTSARSKIAYDRAEILQSEARFKSGIATLEEYKKVFNTDKKIEDQTKNLVIIGAISKNHYDRIKKSAMQTEGKLEAQKNKIIEYQQNIIAYQHKLAEDNANIKKQLLKDWQRTQLQAYDLNKKNVTALNRFHFDWLRSPVDGVVQNLSVASIGSVIQAGQTVATIVPENAPLIVVADVPTQDAGFIRKGQNVMVKVAAFPFEQYGMIKGQVMSVSPTAEPNNTITAPPPGENHESIQGNSQSGQNHSHNQNANTAPPTLYYHVRVKPDKTWLMIDGKKHFMEPGMTVTIDVQTGDRSVLDFFLSPISKYINNGLYVQ